MGASTAVFGLCGAYVAFIVLNYTYLIANNKLCDILIFFALSLFMTIMLGSKVSVWTRKITIIVVVECRRFGSLGWVPHGRYRRPLGDALP